MAIFHRPLPRNLEAALRDLGEKNPLVRRSAIQDLARHAREEASPPIVEALLNSLRDEDPIVRSEAAYCLGDARSLEALPALLMAVDDRHSLVRQAAIDALGTIGDSRATGRLMRALKDDRPDVRFQAVVALSRVSPESGEDAVLQAIKDPDHHVRYIAVRTAEELSWKQDEGQARFDLPERIAKRAKAWLEDEEPHVRLATAILLGRSGNDAGAVELLCAIDDRFQTIEPEDEVAAIELAGTLGLREAIPALEHRAFGLMRLLKEKFPWTARIALVRLGSERAKQCILADLKSWSRDSRTAAVTAAAQAGIKEAIGAIETMRGNHEMAVQEAVDEALELLHARDS